MTIRVTAKLEGLKEAQTALRKLPDSTAKSVMRRVLKKVGKPIAEKAKSLAPESQGELKDSIAVSTKLSKRQRKLFKKRNKHDIYVFVGAGPLPQAHLQEFGTSQHGTQPFMRPAWDSEKQGLLPQIKKELWIEIKAAAERLRRKAARQAKK